MAFFKVGVRLPGVPGMLLVRDVHERSPLSFVADAICVRIGVGVSQFVHLGYERLVPGHSGLEVVSLRDSTRVGQAYNLVLRVSSFELSAVYCLPNNRAANLINSSGKNTSLHILCR